MKPPQHTTPAHLGPTLREVSRWYEHLRQLHARLRPHFARPEVHQQAMRYLQAVLSDVPRKNGWQLAEQARQAHPYGMQRLLSQAVWDQEAVRDEVRRLVSETLRSSRPQEADEALQWHLEREEFSLEKSQESSLEGKRTLQPHF